MAIMARAAQNAAKVGIHAYGNVGYYVAQIAKGFGMEVCF